MQCIDPPLNWYCETGHSSKLICNLLNFLLAKLIQYLADLISNPGDEKLFTANEPNLFLEPIESS